MPLLGDLDEGMDAHLVLLDKCLVAKPFSKVGHVAFGNAVALDPRFVVVRS